MLTDFFILCSGANKEILQECPTERTKFAGIGATIFLTAILASISGGYALYFTFKNVAIAIFFGLLWGCIIFNLDRYIVSSIKKTGEPAQEILTAIPRFIIAIILAVTISKPLEIKLFDGSISKRMGEVEDDYNKNCEISFVAGRNSLDEKKSTLLKELETRKTQVFQNDPVFKDIDNQLQERNKNIGELREHIKNNIATISSNSWEEELRNEITGTVRNIRRYNKIALNKIAENKAHNKSIIEQNKSIGELNDKLKNRKTDLSDQVFVMEKQTANQVAGVQMQIDDMNRRRASILEKCKSDAALDKDILSRLRALGELKSFGNSVWWASLLITFLFIMLETAPIVVKLLAKRGPYDEILDRIEYEIFLKQKTIISDKNDELNTLIQEIRDVNKLKGEVRIKVEKAKLDAELRSNEELLNKIASRQASLAEMVIEKWFREQESNLKG